MIEGLRKIDLADVARESGVELVQSGTRLKGRCPLHVDRTPSFFIFSDDRFRCFGCGESGDAIDFIRKLHGFSFPDALNHLGIKPGPVTPEMKRQIKERKRRADLIRRFRRWEERKADHVAMMLRCTHKAARSWRGIEDFERYGIILEPLAKYEHEMEILISGNDQLKFNLLTGQWGAEPFDLCTELRGWITNKARNNGDPRQRQSCTDQ